MKNFRTFSLVLLLMGIGLYLTGCNFDSGDQDGTMSADSVAIKDSMEVVSLLRKTYQWYETESRLFDFTLKYVDGICVGVDQDAEKKRVLELEQTGLFDPAFIDTYNRISAKIDLSIKSDTVKYFEGDGLELDWIGADPWCNCQDSPENYWDKLVLKSLQLNGDEATAVWTWGEDYTYTVKVKKTKGIWKITSLEGFESVLTTAIAGSRV